MRRNAGMCILFLLVSHTPPHISKSTGKKPRRNFNLHTTTQAFFAQKVAQIEKLHRFCQFIFIWPFWNMRAIFGVPNHQTTRTCRQDILVQTYFPQKMYSVSAL